MSVEGWAPLRRLARGFGSAAAPPLPSPASNHSLVFHTVRQRPVMVAARESFDPGPILYLSLSRRTDRCSCPDCSQPVRPLLPGPRPISAYCDSPTPVLSFTAR